MDHSHCGTLESHGELYKYPKPCSTPARLIAGFLTWGSGDTAPGPGWMGHSVDSGTIKPTPVVRAQPTRSRRPAMKERCCTTDVRVSHSFESRRCDGVGSRQGRRQANLSSEKRVAVKSWSLMWVKMNPGSREPVLRRCPYLSRARREVSIHSAQKPVSRG